MSDAICRVALPSCVVGGTNFQPVSLLLLLSVRQTSAHPVSIVYYLHSPAVNMATATLMMVNANVRQDGEALTA
ncbi:hypothetical protein IW262DRAFT_1468404 [Armillaria fumosa]|nr:hypothetical protein IW262DRAFT_1468404 [Armillaria fumosa]